MTLALVAMLLTACDHRTIYDRYESTALSGWEKNDTITFAIRPLKEAATYRALLGVRTTDSYPFTSLTLIVEQEIMPAHRVLVDTICCELTDEQGKVLGDGIGYRQYQFEVCQLQLQEGDSLHVVVRHDMKREILPGICDVGIKLLKEKKQPIDEKIHIYYNNVYRQPRCLSTRAHRAEPPVHRLASIPLRSGRGYARAGHGGAYGGSDDHHH